MNPVARALWFIEGNLGRDIALDDIAEAACVSRFHLTRAFGEAVAMPVVRYVRARRLSEAAKALAGGAPDILSLALEAGYGSHEAFTRAFRDQFGVTPEAVRGGGLIETLELVEPYLMQETTETKLAAPRFVDGAAMLIAGLCRRYEYGALDGIPGQWQRLAPHIGHIGSEVGDGATYGVCVNADAGGFDYICGVEVRDFSDTAPQMTRLRVPPQRYAVFRHGGHLSGIRATMNAIMGDWLAGSAWEIADAALLERYGPEFDPVSGNGGVEIWVPVTPRGARAG